MASPLAGDNSDARHVVAELIDAAGFDPMDLGPLYHGRWAEPDGLLFGRNGSASDLQSIYKQCTDQSADDELGQDEVCLWCFDLRAEPHVIAKASATLSSAERERASRFARDLLRDNFILARGILRMLLGHYCGLPPESLEFDYGPQGKPFLTRCSCQIRFNMSHSGEIAAYAFAWGCDVGVDVEQHRKLPDQEEIAKRYFSPAEYCELMTVPEHERAAAFYACWVRKEAFLKAKGGGLSIGLDSFQVVSAGPAAGDSFD